MLMDAHVGEGGVKNGQKYAYVISGRPLRFLIFSARETKT